MLQAKALVFLAAAIGTASALLDQNKLATERLFAKLNDPELAPFIDDEMMYGMLVKGHQLDPQNEELARLVAAHAVHESRCTIEHQQWLISRLVRSQLSTPLGAYLAAIRDQYRQLCSDTFKARLLPIIEELHLSVTGPLNAFVGQLQETPRLHDELYKLADLPSSSLASELRQYSVEYADDYIDEDANMYDQREERRDLMKEAHAQLGNSCTKFNITFGDFLWSLKVIERPQQLSPHMEHLLWATKVCRSLQWGSFDQELEEAYMKLDGEQRDLVTKLTLLLRLPGDRVPGASEQLPAESVKQAIKMMASEHMFLNERAKKFEATARLHDELEVACKSHLEGLRDFLYLFDSGLRQAPLTSGSLAALRRVRVCELLPFLQV